MRRVVNYDRHVLRPQQRRVGRGFVNANFQIGLRILPGHMATGQDIAVSAARNGSTTRSHG